MAATLCSLAEELLRNQSGNSADSKGNQKILHDLHAPLLSSLLPASPEGGGALFFDKLSSARDQPALTAPFGL